MDKQKRTRYLKLLLKVALTGAALYLVYIKIDIDVTKAALLQANPLWLVPAAILFNASKVTSALRLNYFFKAEALQLSQRYNLVLYYIGMFYNLFLPGGIGGDGYKVYLLNKQYKTPVKGLLAAVFVDRLSGLVSLGFLALILFVFSSAFALIGPWQYLIWAGIVLAYVVYYFLIRLLFKKYLTVYLPTNVQSFAVQALQVVCAWFILLALGVEAHYTDYTTLFLVSSVVAVLPFTIGGVGARELVFIYGYEYLQIDKNVAVVFSILFFVITAVSSLAGAFLKAEDPNKNEATTG